ncbi:hypothetical protein EU546_06870 [Candidatus Thorarchaeota archaeon]|nr:MAG: hypothetical protein EU546_06870 [Candidatus Thorarchaeota archaeon]
MGRVVAGWLLTMVVAILWLLTDTLTALVFTIGIGIEIGVALVTILNEAAVSTMVATLQRAGEGAVKLLSLRKNMRVLLARRVIGLFTIVVIMTALNLLDIDTFNAIMAVLGSFVASIIAYYFASSRSEETQE